LRSSGSSRLPSAPTSPERRGHDAHAADSHVDEQQQRRARRVQKAKDRIRAEKQAIRQRQAELEAARSEWRRDMRDAKDRGDRKQQQLLHVAKGVLEERARVLNRDTADLRQSMEMVKEEERRAGLRDSSDGARVYDMLKAIATKVEHVEARLAHSGSGRQRPSSPRRETSEKWHRYMRPSSASGSRHVDVEGWLEETAP
jgi:chromosome segregation ATPase